MCPSDVSLMEISNIYLNHAADIEALKRGLFVIRPP